MLFCMNCMNLFWHQKYGKNIQSEWALRLSVQNVLPKIPFVFSRKNKIIGVWNKMSSFIQPKFVTHCSILRGIMSERFTGTFHHIAVASFWDFTRHNNFCKWEKTEELRDFTDYGETKGKKGEEKELWRFPGRKGHVGTPMSYPYNTWILI